MKKLTLLLLLLINVSVFAQKDFKWDRIYDIEGSQYDLFIKAKKFISRNKGVQYADEKNHVIVAYLNTKAKYQATSVIFDNLIFEYQITIMTKENKVRVLFDSVYCVEKKYNNLPAGTIYPGDQCGLEMAVYYKVMTDLRDQLNKAMDDVEMYMKEPLPIYIEW